MYFYNEKLHCFCPSPYLVRVIKIKDEMSTNCSTHGDAKYEYINNTDRKRKENFGGLVVFGRINNITLKKIVRKGVDWMNLFGTEFSREVL